MKSKIAFSVLLAAMLCASLNGCALLPDSEGTSEESSAADASHSDVRYDLTAMRKKAEELKDTWTYQNKSSEIEASLQDLIQDVNKVYAIYARAEIASDADWNDKDLYTLKNQTCEDYYIASDILNWVIANGCKKSMYSEIFEPYCDFDGVDYYLVNNLSRTIASARSSATGSNELIDDYYDTAYHADAEQKTDDINLHCAELYLETLKNKNAGDDFYATFHRDYTPDDVAAVFAEIKEKIIPLFRSLNESVMDIEQPATQLHGDAYDILQENAPKLSPEIGKSVQKLMDEKLFTIGKGSDCYDGSYTIMLGDEPRALMYTYLDNSFYDIVTVSHEFGHFHSDLNVNVPICLQSMNLDIAEAQSQCMEMLFTSCYSDIFGKDASYYELMELYNMIDNIICGFAVGQFENDVIAQLDSITPEEVVALYDEYRVSCDLVSEFYEINHLFEDPGYYISYGVSALPALQIYTIMQDDLQNAVSIYDKLSHISSATNSNTFSDTMKECGFRSCFEPETLDIAAAELEERIAVLQKQATEGA